VLVGANYEDAIIISERWLKIQILIDPHRRVCLQRARHQAWARGDYARHPERIEAKLRNLDEDGVVRVGSEVRPGDILVGKITPKGETQLTPEERLLRSASSATRRAMLKTLLRMENGKRGRIIGVKVFSREQVTSSRAASSSASILK
jgi:DNA-directed RNA polymerase subunit beta